MGQVRRFAALPPGDRALVLQAFALLLAVRVTLHRVELPRLRAALDRIGAPGRELEDAPSRIAFAIGATAPLVPRASCLTQALVADTLLRRCGRPSEIRIGVARASGGGLRAHAWALSAGEVVVGGPAGQGYTDLGPLADDSALIR